MIQTSECTEQPEAAVLTPKFKDNILKIKALNFKRVTLLSRPTGQFFTAYKEDKCWLNFLKGWSRNCFLSGRYEIHCLRHGMTKHHLHVGPSNLSEQYDIQTNHYHVEPNFYKNHVEHLKKKNRSVSQKQKVGLNSPKQKSRLNRQKQKSRLNRQKQKSRLNRQMQKSRLNRQKQKSRLNRQMQKSQLNLPKQKSRLNPPKHKNESNKMQVGPAKSEKQVGKNAGWTEFFIFLDRLFVILLHNCV